MNGCFRVLGQSNTVEDVEKSRETPKRERIQKSFAVIVEVVIVGRATFLTYSDHSS